jgi:hypothetical protein
MRRAIVVLLVLPVLASCSTVPTSSNTVQITQAPERPPQEVGIEPLPPEPGSTPEEIVRDFIGAAASRVAGHPVAQEYLAPQARESWSDESGIYVISQDFATVTTDADSVQVSANLVGTVDERGVFQIGGNAGVFTREFAVDMVDGEWRITNPPGGLTMLQPDFERLYRRLQAYFLDPTGQRVVPDPRYLISGDSQPTALVSRVLEGPSSPLTAGVRNPLSGVQLRSAVAVDGQAAVVDLTGVPTDPEPALGDISAQLVWTLRQLGIRTVEVRVDGRPVRLEGIPAQQTTDDWPSFDPDVVPVEGVGHYVDGGALKLVTTGEGTPGPAGTGAYDLTSAAVKADDRTGELSFLVGVRKAGSGQELLAGPYDGDLAVILPGRTFSAPTVASTRPEAWVIRDGTAIVRAQAGGTPQAVNSPTLAGLGRADVLRLSPDGVRAAMVIDGPEGPTLYIGTVVRAEDGSVSLRDLRAIAPSLSQVVDVAWRDSEELLVLASDAREDQTVPYSVGVDGWGLDDVPTSGLPLPNQPTAIAAAPTRQPLVSAGRTIWQLAGSTWVTLERGAEPRPGTAPFYPL